MAEEGELSNRSWRRPAPVLFTLLVSLNLAFQVFLNPIGVSADAIPEWLGQMLMGFLISQPVLFGIWAALGSGTFLQRASMTSAALAAVFLAGTIKRWNFWGESVTRSFDDLFWVSGFFLFVTTAMLLVRKFAGWRIASTLEQLSMVPVNQFSLRFLLGLTTVCALLLGMGRGLASTNASAAIFAGITLLLLFPVMELPFVVLSVRPAKRLILLVPLIWVALTWLAAEAVATTANAPRSQLARQLVFVQLGAAILSLTSAIMLRFAGYRFYRPSRDGRGQNIVTGDLGDGHVLT